MLDQLALRRPSRRPSCPRRRRASGRSPPLPRRRAGPARDDGHEGQRAAGRERSWREGVDAGRRSSNEGLLFSWADGAGAPDRGSGTSDIRPESIRVCRDEGQTGLRLTAAGPVRKLRAAHAVRPANVLPDRDRRDGHDAPRRAPRRARATGSSARTARSTPRCPTASPPSGSRSGPPSTAREPARPTSTRVVVGNLARADNPELLEALAARPADRLDARDAPRRDPRRPAPGRRRRDARQDDDDGPRRRGSSPRPGRDPGFLVGGEPLNFDAPSRARHGARLRRRGGRVLDLVRRQGAEVPPLRAPDVRPDVGRVRPRRPLRGPRRREGGVPEGRRHRPRGRPRSSRSRTTRTSATSSARRARP